MNIRFLRAAERQLRSIVTYIAREDRRAAEALVKRVDAHFELMAATGFTDIGKRGRLRGTRQIVEGKYILVYRHDTVGDEIVVLSITHGARRR